MKVLLVLRIVVLLLGVSLLFVGFVGFFRPERLAEALALTPVPPVGIGSIRAMVGAHYLAMGLVAILAAVRGYWAWLVPLAAIEGCMVLARIMATFNGELGPTGTSTLVLETICTLAFGLGAFLPARLAR